MEHAGPIYPLEEVRLVLATKRRVTFSFNAEAGYQELGITIADAIYFIENLLPSEYRKSISYENQQPFDDYVTGPHKVPCKGKPVFIYIKFRIPNPRVVDYIYVTSFHESNQYWKP